MANHVSSYLKFVRVNDAGLDFIKKELERINAVERKYGELNIAELEGYTTFEEMCNNVGAKWAYIIDADEGGISFNSAWTPPTEWIQELIAEIGKIDSNSICEFTYEDEMPNFVGAFLYKGGELLDGCEEEGDEILEKALEDDELREHWDETLEEFDEEGQDMYNDMVWDLANECQSEILNSCYGQLEEV
jgi:hypothetical protein